MRVEVLQKDLPSLCVLQEMLTQLLHSAQMEKIQSKSYGKSFSSTNTCGNILQLVRQ